MKFIFLAVLCICLCVTVIDAQSPPPPIAEKRPHSLSRHGINWTDDYHWLRNREDPSVLTHLKAENQYTDTVLAPLNSLRGKIVAELKTRVIGEDISVPYRKGDWLYYSRDIEGKDHSLLCRKPYPEGPETILLDLNERAGTSDGYTFGGAAISPNGNLYAWKENTNGTDRYTIHIKDLTTGKILPDQISDTAFAESPVWALDNQTLFYTEADATERSCRVKRHTLGTNPTDNPIVYEDHDTTFQVAIGATKSERFMRLTSRSKDTMETSLIPLDQPDAKPILVAPRRTGIRYALSDTDQHWFILSSENAINGSIFRAPLDQPTRANWTEILPGNETISYGSVEAFTNHVILEARKDGIPGLYILDPANPSQPRWFTAPSPGSWFSTENTPHFQSTFQRISYETLLQPYTVSELDLTTGNIKPVKQKASPPGYDSSKYRVEQTHAPAKDGTLIPIWLLLPKNHPTDGTGAILIDGYGAYGSPNDPWFNSNLFSLLDRGIGFAIAQIRGGGELGRRWYEAGKLAHKQTTFDDFIACAEHLIQQKYTSKENLCGYGGSAGGLLVGAVINQQPDLFRAFIADVPFVDVLNTMLDPTIPLTTSEYDEWGNPSATLETFNRIRAYSPYDNIKPQNYPSLLVLAGLNDSRVPYWEAAKWVAKLRATKTDQNPLLLQVDLDTGHSGSSGRYSFLERVALQYTFLIEALGRDKN
ncbi:S9 family peptidase [Phragmitibacter flavus]|nr:S9 family peptidase [Phragmitibacter flavus]